MSCIIELAKYLRKHNLSNATSMGIFYKKMLTDSQRGTPLEKAH
jgi:hypothetical protein